MGDYISATEVADQLPRTHPSYALVTATSKPIDYTQLDSIIQEIESEIHGAAMEGGYSVPIPSTATYAYRQLKLVAREGAGWHALETIFPGKSMSDDSFLGSQFRVAYLKALADLKSGTLVLIGAPESTGEDGRLMPAWGGQPSPIITMAEEF